MAGQLGGLVVSLGLNAVEFTAGLTKAERDAKVFASRVNTAILQVGKVFAGLAIGEQFLSAAKDIISSAGALDDLSDATGSSVESLSRLSNQAAISGRSFDDLQTAMLKLASGMGGLDDDSNKVINALKTLGITTKDPAQALQEIAVKFNQFADGARKAAFARELFGKSGPQFLAALKDIAELQDVTGTVTAKQAADAEALEKAFRRLSVEATGFKNVVLNDMVPALLKLIEDMREGTKIAGGFFSAIALFGTINPFKSLGDNLRTVQASIDELEASKKNAPSILDSLLNRTGVSDRALDQAKRQAEFLKSQIRREALSLISPDNSDARDLRAQRKPELPPLPDPGKASRESKKILDQQLKALDNFISDERDTLSTREEFLRTYYQDDQLGLRDFFQGRRNAIDEAVKNETEAFDKQIALLQSFAAKAKPEDRIDAETKIADITAKRARLQSDAATKGIILFLDEQRAVNALKDSITQASIALQEMQGDSTGAAGAAFDLAHRKILSDLQLLSKSANPEDQATAQQGQAVIEQTRQLTIARAALAQSTQSYNLTLDELGIAQQRIDIAQQTGDLTTLGGLRAKSELAAKYTVILKEQLALLELQAAQTGKPEDLIRVKQLQVQLESLAATGDLVAKQFNDIFATSFANGIAEAVSGTKSLKDAFLDTAKSIEQAITRIAAQNIAEAIFGGKGAGSGIGDLFSKLFGGPSGQGFDFSKIFSSLFGGPTGDIFGVGLAGGTDNWRGGPTWVGEHGPEIVNLPKGASVTPAAESAKLFGPRMNFVINVLPGASTRTANQAALQTGIAVQRAFAKNG